ncbi:MAG: hypothetical protein KAV00_01280 [Phycisphaerae bacterium]|nr:hypothetical protein [Phycisphaerae bacterium]
MRRTTIVLSAVVVIFAALSSHTSATDKTPASKPAPAALKTGYTPLPKGTVRIWDLGKKCTKKIKGFFHKEGGWYYRDNWILVPHGTTDYKFKGDCALEGTNFWIHLHGHKFDAIFIYPKVDDKGTPGGDNELYRSHSPAGSGLRNYGEGSNKARVIKNAPGEIAVESESHPSRGSRVTTVYRILAGRPWVEITPVRMATEQGMHGETRMLVFPEAGRKGQDFLADAAIYAPHHPNYHKISFPTKSRMMLDLMMDDDQMYVVTWPTPKKARPWADVSTTNYHRGWNWIGEGKSAVWGSSFAYFGDETEPIIIGSLRFGYWHYQKINAKVKAGEKFTGRWKCVRTRLGYRPYAKEIGAGYPFMKGASWRPIYPGKWRMIGCIDKKHYTREVIVSKADTKSSAFEFTSPVSGTLEYVLIYLYDRTKETPKDVFTPMDIYRQAIQGKKPAAPDK